MPKKYGKEIIKAKYLDILNYVKVNGFKVIHTKHSNKNLAGTFDPDTKIIWINKNDKFTLDGCFTLLHELGHAYQYSEERFKEFMSLGMEEEYSEYKMDLIIEAEVDASQRAMKLLKEKWKIYYRSDDSTVKGLKDCIKFWRKWYFKN